MQKSVCDLKLRWLSSLEKIPPYAGKIPEAHLQDEVLRGEKYHLQLLFQSQRMHNRKAQLTVLSPLADLITVRDVEYVPVSFSGYCKCDSDVLSSSGGIFPDRLTPLQDNCTRVVIRQTRTLWITVHVPADLPAGDYPIRIQFKVYPDDCDESGLTQKIETFLSGEFHLKVLDAVLPPERLKVTQWFHCDSLADFYHCPVWSEEHWQIIARFMKNAAEHGMNMILTPILTLPLNVFPGTHRTISQLVEISCRKGKYQFDFSRLERFVRLAQSCGIRGFEIGHFFTQWGAAFAATAEIDGQIQFGWKCAGNAPEYRSFLQQLLQALTGKLNQLGIAGQTVFHCSDEPGLKHIPSYRDAIEFMKRNLPGFRIIDAINSAKVFQASGMDTPVPLTTDLSKFSALKLPERWTYYCCAPTTRAPNRFIHFPSSRNRIFGVLLWKYGMDAFLHWGFNFYYEALSRFLIDPMRDSTCDRFYPPGDAFLVYPGKDGKPEDSIRHEVFLEALQDFRALDLLATLTSKADVHRKLIQWCGRLTMLQYPRGSRNVRMLRRKINQAIISALKTGKKL